MELSSKNDIAGPASTQIFLQRNINRIYNMYNCNYTAILDRATQVKEPGCLCGPDGRRIVGSWGKPPPLSHGHIGSRVNEVEMQ
jgi:hypothetical protein